ncbi:hypothetical protein [Mycobacterium sp.]|uniref:hypothetical protein n=1 Tax=Mycobacterium sp. TaxID=1785 RepID=UPI002D8F494D|nr:hypothetical protein [Mycobacterium sp.]
MTSPPEPFERRPFDATGLAWELVQMASGQLSRVERRDIYIAIGAGDAQRAVATLLTILVQRRLAVPRWVPYRLERWIKGYSGCADEYQLQSLLEQLNVVHRQEPQSRSDATILDLAQRYRTGRRAGSTYAEIGHAEAQSAISATRRHRVSSVRDQMLR